MRGIRVPIEVQPLLSSSPAAGPLVEPEPGWSPQPHAFRDVYVLPDGQTLELHATRGGWQQLHGVEVDETGSDVVVTLLLAYRERPRGFGFYTLVGHPFRVHVRLARALGRRRVLDGALPTAGEARAAAIAREVAWRTEVGLPAEPDQVAQLWDARATEGVRVLRDDGSGLLTADEAAWYSEAQKDVHAALAFVRNWLAGRDPEVRGGVMLVEADGGATVAMLTDPVAIADLRADALAAGVRRLVAREVAYSEQQLGRWHDELRAVLTAAGVDLRGSGPETRQNRIRLHVWDDDDLEGTIAHATELAATVAPRDAFVVGE